jgi:hypothetical protein
MWKLWACQWAAFKHVVNEQEPFGWLTRQWSSLLAIWWSSQPIHVGRELAVWEWCCGNIKTFPHKTMTSPPEQTIFKTKTDVVVPNCRLFRADFGDGHLFVKHMKQCMTTCRRDMFGTHVECSRGKMPQKHFCICRDFFTILFFCGDFIFLRGFFYLRQTDRLDRLHLMARTSS